MNKMTLLMMSVSVLLVFVLYGCSSGKEASVTSTESTIQSEVHETTSSSETPLVAACTTKDCFIDVANMCTELSLTMTEEAGVFMYSSSENCVFTKTLVTADETLEVKKLLEGKSLTCQYSEGKFDSRWINSLVFGIEYCNGELKDTLVSLLAFV